MIKNIYNDYLFTIREKVLLKSITCICKKSCAINLILYLKRCYLNNI